MKSNIIKKNTNLVVISLKKLGLENLEVDIYINLLQNPELNITDLSLKIGVYRLKIYTALEKLEQLGLVSKQENYNRKIELSPPTKISTLLKKQERELSRINADFDELLPQLQTQYYNKSRQPVTRIYEGLSQFIQIFHNILDEVQTKDTIEILGENKDFYQLIDMEYYRQNWMKPRVKKGVFVRVLLHANNYDFLKYSSDNLKELREMKILPAEFQSNGSVWISKNKIINWNTVLARAVVVEDKVIADFYRDIFQTIWKNASN